MKTKHSTTNYKALISFIEKVNELDGYAKFIAPGYMDLVIENIGYRDHEGHAVYSIAHYGELNGDLMRDPEMTFSVDFENKCILPLSYRNDYMGFDIEYFVCRNGKCTGYRPQWLHDGDNFLWTWARNIKEQGFTPEQHTDPTWMIPEA